MTAMSLSDLELKISTCRRCESTLCRYGIEPRSVFDGRAWAPVFLIGQAPGKTEYELRMPFQGDAGKSIKSLFLSCGLRDFERVVYQTSVTKCFPGRREGTSADRMPSVREVKKLHTVPYAAVGHSEAQVARLSRPAFMEGFLVNA